MDDDDDPTMDFEAPTRLSRPVTLRALLAAVVLTALLSIAAGAAISAVLVERGPAGPPGEEGPAGDPGPPGAEGDAAGATVDPEEVLTAIEEDPAGVAEAVADELDFAPTSDLEDVRATADEAATAADEVRTDLASLCSDLGFAPALSDEVLSC